jgi:hypothetical protein
MLILRFCRLSFLAALFCLLLAATIMPARAEDESVRVATFNAFLPSALFRCSNGGEPLTALDCVLGDDPTPTWANDIADLVLSDPSRFDIIALNEVWTEETRDILINRLGGIFSTHVAELDGDLIQLRHQSLLEALALFPLDVLEAVFAGVPIAQIKGEDSGLMLFVSPRFEVLPLPDPTYLWGDDPGEALTANTSDVAFVLFESCTGVDCLAAKGAGLIRLRERSTGRIFNVVFTHMQADDIGKSEFHPGERAAQFNEMLKMIETTIGPVAELGQERLIIMGDLNIPMPNAVGTAEWTQLFATPGTPFTDDFHDTWASTTSPKDKGLTNKVEGLRLDFILAGGQRYETGGIEGPICVQHLTIPRDFAVSTSDHKLVHADLNAGAPYCYPQAAYDVRLAKTYVNGLPRIEQVIDDATEITYPGSMQWFRVVRDGPGTFSIGLDRSQVKMDIYTPEDLTTPVSRYFRIPRIESDGERKFITETFVLPSEFYIRVSGRQRSFTGPYALRVRQHTCATQEEACILRPGEVAQSAVLTKNNNPGGSQDEAWFRFVIVGKTDSGAPQTITLTAGGLTNPRLSAELVDLIETSGGPGPVVTQVGDDQTFAGPMGDGSSGYLVIKQSMADVSDTVVTARMESDFKALTLFQLVCEDETNPEFGSDEIFTTLTLDGVANRLPPSGYVEFDCDSPRDPKNWGWNGNPRYYVGPATIRLVEDDDLSPSDPSSLRTLPVPVPGPHGTREWFNWHFDGGFYRLEFEVLWQENKPVE